jgi:antitoxin component of MazEF toxin-antitoxin module
MKAKIVKHGNGRAVMIPAAIANSLGWQIGKSVELEQLASGVAVRSPAERTRDRDFRRALAEVFRVHDSTFRDLADR